MRQLLGANYMVTNNTTSTAAGDPWADITNAGYNYWTADIADTWGDTTPQQVVSSLTSSTTKDFGDTTAYSDIGVGIVPDTINGNETQLIVVYLATITSPALTQSIQQLNAQNALTASCPQLEQDAGNQYSQDFTNAGNEQIAYENSVPNPLTDSTSQQEIANYTDTLNSQLESDYAQISHP